MTKRNIKNVIGTLLAAVVAVAFTACSDSDSYERAGKVAEGNTVAYFASSNTANEVLTPVEYADHQSFTLTVKRNNTAGDVSVPIVIDYADAAFDIPSAAAFKDGEGETTVEVGCANLEQRKTYKFSIHLAEENTNPYLATDGSPVFNYSILVANWVKVVNQAQMVWNKSEFSTSYSDIYWLEGQNRFRIENFLGSGIDLQYYIVALDSETGEYKTDAFNANDRKTWHGAFVPYDHWMSDPYGGSYWYLMNDVESEDYASWYPDGESHLGIKYVNFYESPTSEDYASIDMRGSTTTYAAFLIPYVYYTDGTQSGYTYLYMYWDSSNLTDAE